MESEIDAKGLDALMPDGFVSNYARPRRFEVGRRKFGLVEALRGTGVEPRCSFLGLRCPPIIAVHGSFVEPPMTDVWSLREQA